MNTLIVKAGLDIVKQYTGRSVYAKMNKKRFAVVFRVPVDDYSVEEAMQLAKRDANILMLYYVGSQSTLATLKTNGAYISWAVEVGVDVTEEDIQNYLSLTPEGMSLIIKLPTEYKNIRFLYNMSQKYGNVRFCGGKLFCFNECKFGCCGRDICAERGIKFEDSDYIREGCSCALPVVELEDVELSIDDKQKSDRKSSKTKSDKPKKPSKSELFSALLYRGGKVEL